MRIIGLILPTILLLPSLVLGHSYGPPLPSVDANTLVSHSLLKIAIGAYVAAIIINTWSSVSGKEKLSAISKYATLSAITLHAAGYLLRWKETYDYGWGHFPLSNSYEYISVFCLMLAVTGCCLQLKSKGEAIAGTFLFVATILLAANLKHPTGISALFDIKQQNDLEYVNGVKLNYLLFSIRNFIFSAGYSLLTSAGIVAVLVSTRTLSGAFFQNMSNRIPSEKILYEWNRIFIIGGTSLLYSGFLFSLFWSNYAWGTYWSWAPEETLLAAALISYTVFLVRNSRNGWDSSRAKNRSLLGLGIIISIYFLIH